MNSLQELFKEIEIALRTLKYLLSVIISKKCKNYLVAHQAPQSSETFLYLALIANQQKQPANAESLARRGLSYAQSNAMKKQLWSIILKAGQMQKNQKTIQQAQTAIKSLS